MKTIDSDLDAFIFVKEHLLTQKDKSTDLESDKCMYRGYPQSEVIKLSTLLEEKFGVTAYEALDPDNAIYTSPHLDLKNKVIYESYKLETVSCAIGCLISNNWYDDELEHNGLEEESVVEAVSLSNPHWDMTENSLELLIQLQRVHDMTEVERWEECLNTFEDYFLSNKTFQASEYLRFAIKNRTKGM